MPFRRLPPSASVLLSIFVLSACSEHDEPQDAASAGLPAWLTERAAEELKLAARSPAFHDFRFTDQLSASGIMFASHVVDDASKNYKAVHYDHGFGLAAADVDGDGLVDLYFVTQLGTNELWKNLGNGTFANITGSAGVGLKDQISVGASFADVDNDGKPDLFVTTVRHGNRLFRNLGDGKFQDITAQAGVGYSGHSSGAVFFDYDRDGLVDLFVTNVGVYTSNTRSAAGHYVGLSDAFKGHNHPERAEASILYRNVGGGKFEDVTQKTQLVDKSWSGDAVVMDVNDDDWPDLYLLNMQGQNHLWLNVRGASFRDATPEYFAKTPWGAMGAKVFDFDGDGSLDLYLTDMHSDMFDDVPPGNWDAERRKSDPTRMPADVFPGGKSQFLFGNALFARRAGSGLKLYDDVSDRAGVETYWPWGPSVGDLNADGWDDLFVANSMNFPFRYAPNSIFLNEEGKRFLPAAFTLGIEPRTPALSKWFDLACNGIDSKHPACARCKRPDAADAGCRETAPGNFTVVGARGTRSAVIVDVDNDGDLDLVTNEFNEVPMVQLSDLSAKRHVNWLKVALRGTRSNRAGLGAHVTLVLPDGKRFLKVMDGKSGYLSQSDVPLYFGLGDAASAASIEVSWPSGRKQVIAGPVPGRTLKEITEP